MDKILLIQSLPLPKELTNKILIDYKYNMLETKYKRQFHELNKHFLYYAWMNKKIRKFGLHGEEPDPSHTLIKTIKMFDYYKPFAI